VAANAIAGSANPRRNVNFVFQLRMDISLRRTIDGPKLKVYGPGRDEA
jgi:hypothetical protein